MKVEEVPQDRGMINEEHGCEVCYAVTDDGCYTLSRSAGWEVKNIVNDQAWSIIIEETQKAHAKVLNGDVSPIAYYAAKNQMDVSLLACYVQIAKWRVKRHYKPSIFNRLSDKLLEKYAAVFNVSVQELQQVPAKFDVNLIISEK